MPRKGEERMAEINPDCPCTWPGCENHGNCRACQANHNPYGEKTACQKLAAKQAERDAVSGVGKR